MRRWGVVMVAVAGCSFGMKTDRMKYVRDQPQEPTCSESYVRPGFDGAMVASTAAGAGALAAYLADYGCRTDGYEYRFSCGTYAGMFTALAVVGGAYVAGALYGVKHAKRCERDNDEYDQWLATQPGTKMSEEEHKVCIEERARLLRAAKDNLEIDKIQTDMPCTDEPPTRTRRYRGAASDGIVKGIGVGAVSVLLGMMTFAIVLNERP